MRRNSSLVFLSSVLSSALVAQEVDVPVRNWTVPPYTQAAAGGGGITTMTDVTPPRVFVGVAPCRVADTRGLGFSGQAGPPAINTGPRTFQIAGTVGGVSAQCGIPLGTEAVSFQFTIVTPNAAGNLIAWPGGAAPTISVLNWDAGAIALGNGTIVPLSGTGALSVQINAAVGSATGHLVIDVNGYFGDILGNSANRLVLVSVSPGQETALFFNQSTATNSEGVHGTSSGGIDSAGVFGQMGGQVAIFALDEAGVRGETTRDFGIGVIGISKRAGVNGVLVTPAGGRLADGYLAASFGTDPGGGGPNWAVFGQGDIGASGTKFFLDPHPTDPSKVIGYISLEGPEAGTYFRGRGRFQNGMARIVVPEDFRLVTDPEGLTVQVTPIGAMASVGVLRMDLREIVVQASRSVEFSYLVQGVRATSARRPPIFEDGMFVPARADATMPEWLTDGQKARLIQNGTYEEDGTVNMETARRNGWDRMWAERKRPTPVSPSD